MKLIHTNYLNGPLLDTPEADALLAKVAAEIGVPLVSLKASIAAEWELANLSQSFSEVFVQVFGRGDRS